MFKDKSRISIDLFSGAGGMSKGAEIAGIPVATAIELNPHAAETHRKNFPETKLINEDISKLSPKEIVRKIPFLIFGGPPCQGFSTANRKTRDKKNQNNKLYKEFIRFIQELKPEWFVFENVEGFTHFAAGEIYNELKTQLGHTYTISDAILNASDYGVPQNRMRFFMVGNKQGFDFKFPKKTHTNNKITVNEAISDLPPLSNGDVLEIADYRSANLNRYTKNMRKKSKCATQNIVSRNQEYVVERYKHIKQGQNWSAIPKDLMQNYKNSMNCHSSIYKRLKLNEPSVVIAQYRKNMLIHPRANRGLSVREAARLQSFPDDFTFYGPLGEIQQQIGNAVPPILASAIFRQILKYT